jgi:ubiquitin C-terminal hydrolase
METISMMLVMSKFLIRAFCSESFMVRCVECSRGKQDAEKGVVFTELPPVLTIHLKRFEFDMQRMVRSDHLCAACVCGCY